MANIISSYWNNFILHSNPNPTATANPTSTQQNLEIWEAYDINDDNIMKLHNYNDIFMETGVKYAECDFFNKHTNQMLIDKFGV